MKDYTNTKQEVSGRSYLKENCSETTKVARDWSVQFVYNAAVNRLCWYRHGEGLNCCPSNTLKGIF